MSVNSLLDIYYKRPLLYDIIINIVALSIIISLEQKGYLNLYFDKDSQSIPTIGITVSGFILTLLTILLTLKSNAIINKETSSSTNFNVFLSSNLYAKAILILKNGVVSLLLVSFLTLAFSVLLPLSYSKYGIYCNVICILFILLVFMRSFYILNLIFKMQVANNNE